MKKMAFLLLIGLALSLTLLTLAFASPCPDQLERSVMASAGTAMTSPSYRMNSTLGQPSAIGISSTASYELGAGYWHRLSLWLKVYLPLMMKNFTP